LWLRGSHDGARLPFGLSRLVEEPGSPVLHMWLAAVHN
jgi:hypothetical protein